MWHSEWHLRYIENVEKFEKMWYSEWHLRYIALKF
jgi:hypothetical protein